MMQKHRLNIIEFISWLHRQDIKLSTNGEKLLYDAPKGTVTKELLKEIGDRKAEILQFLQQVNRDSSSTLPEIKTVSRDKPLPLSFSQERMWFIDRLEGEKAPYIEHSALRIIGDLDLNALQRSLSEIVRRHEILRTSCQMLDGIPQQVIHSDVTLDIKLVDLQQYSQIEKEKVLRQYLQQEANTPFNLETAPLIRCSLLQLSEPEYVLVLSMHHIVGDVWSAGIFIQELSSLYRAFIHGKLSPLPELPVQYADFAVWQRKLLHEGALATQLNYWLAQLANAPELLQLPTDSPRPHLQTYQGNTQIFTLNNDLTQQLQALSRESDTTLFMTLYGAFATLLYRYSGQADILIGSPIANRNHSEIENLIGFFVNTLVLRTDFADNPSFKDLLARVKETTLQAYKHQNVPFEKIVDALQPQRSLSHSPLFQVFFVLQNAPKSKLELPGVTWNKLEIKNTTTKFDLSLSLTETEAGLLGEWEYNTDLFDRNTIESLAGNFQHLLEAIIKNPSQKVGEINILSEAERDRILNQWNDTATDYPQDKCIHQLFTEQVAKNPEEIAIVFEDRQLTYRELDRKANLLAAYLQSWGVKPEVLVGIYIERSLEMIIGLLGILKAGGAYVPLDPEYPQERLDYMVEDSGIAVILTQESLRQNLSSQQLKIVCLDSDWSKIEQYSQENLDLRVESHNLAYVIYTSGSTGKPKGVAIEHRQVGNFFTGMDRTIGNCSPGIWLALTTICFDISVLELFWTLTRGFKVIIAPEKHKLFSFDPSQQNNSSISALIQKYNVSHLQCTPSLLKMLPDGISSLKSLKKVLVGGEALSISLAKELASVVDGEIHNMYGPTEATIWSTVYTVKKDCEKIAIGRPIANTQIYILDEYQQPVPIGVAGEIYISGDGLARGYLNRPELTKERFIPNPFSVNSQQLSVNSNNYPPLPHSPNPLLYKTGDLARYLSSGEIEYLGRIDNQVKIRGFRIELGEMETVLSFHPQIQQAVVIAREHDSGNKRLVAYLVTPEESISHSQLREYLKQKLPEYSIPSAFVVLEKLPLTPNGKIDRQALPAPEVEITRESEYIPPRDRIEQTLADIWQELLSVENISINDNFFEIGGDSILSIQVVSRARKAGIEIIPKQVFQNQTIEQLATVANTISVSVEQSTVKEETPLDIPRLNELLPSVDTNNIESVYSLTPTQQGILFHSLYAPDSGVYCEQILLNLSGKINITAFKAAWQKVIARHGILRTFLVIENRPTPLQVVLKQVDLPWQDLDWQQLSTTKQERELSQLLQAKRQQGFKFSQAPLMRCTLIQLDEDNYKFIWSHHHILMDGWCFPIIFKELLSFYEAEVKGETFQLKSPRPYRDYITWLKERDQESAIAFWRERLQGFSAPTSLMVDKGKFSTEIKAESDYREEKLLLSSEVSQQLQSVAQQYRVTVSTIVQAVWGLLLSRYSGDRDVLFGVTVSGRTGDLSGIEEMVGLFINTLPLRLKINPKEQLNSWLAKIQQSILDLQQYGYTPLVDIQAASEVRGGISLFDTVVVLENYPIDSALLNRDFALEIKGVETFEQNQNNYPLTLLAMPGEEFFVKISYDTTRFDRNTIEGMLGHLQTTFSAMVENPELSLNELTLFKESEKQHLSQKSRGKLKDIKRNPIKVQKS